MSCYHLTEEPTRIVEPWLLEYEGTMERTTGCHKLRSWTNKSLLSGNSGQRWARIWKEPISISVTVQKEISTWLERRTSGSKFWPRGWASQAASNRKGQIQSQSCLCVPEGPPIKGGRARFWCRDKDRHPIQRGEKALKGNWMIWQAPNCQVHQTGDKVGNSYVPWTSRFWIVLDSWHFQSEGNQKDKGFFFKELIQLNILRKNLLGRTRYFDSQINSHLLELTKSYGCQITVHIINNNMFEVRKACVWGEKSSQVTHVVNYVHNTSS